MNRKFSSGWSARTCCDGLQAINFPAQVDVLARAALFERSREDALDVAELFEPLANLGQAIAHEIEHIIARSLVGMGEAEQLADVFDAEASGLRGADKAQALESGRIVLTIVAV